MNLIKLNDDIEITASVSIRGNRVALGQVGNHVKRLSVNLDPDLATYSPTLDDADIEAVDDQLSAKATPGVLDGDWWELGRNEFGTLRGWLILAGRGADDFVWPMIVESEQAALLLAGKLKTSWPSVELKRFTMLCENIGERFAFSGPTIT